MEKKILNLLNLVNNSLLDRNFLDIACLQEQADLINEWLESSKKLGNGNVSNYLWALKSIILIKKKYIESFLLIKNKEYIKAWGLLAALELDIQFLEQNKEELIEETQKRSLIFYKNAVKNWQILFPYKLFFSIGFLVSKNSCSICGKQITPRNKCEHKKGKLYNGELCMHIGEMSELREVSLVTNPMDKNCFIQDIDYDYRVVEYVSNQLIHAYDGWGVHKTKHKWQRSKLDHINKDAVCPCGEMILFKDCCFDKAEIELPHFEIFFVNNRKDSLSKATLFLGEKSEDFT